MDHQYIVCSVFTDQIEEEKKEKEEYSLKIETKRFLCDRCRKYADDIYVYSWSPNSPIQDLCKDCWGLKIEEEKKEKELHTTELKTYKRNECVKCGNRKTYRDWKNRAIWIYLNTGQFCDKCYKKYLIESGNIQCIECGKKISEKGWFMHLDKEKFWDKTFECRECHNKLSRRHISLGKKNVTKNEDKIKSIEYKRSIEEYIQLLIDKIKRSNDSRIRIKVLDLKNEIINELMKKGEENKNLVQRLTKKSEGTFCGGIKPHLAENGIFVQIRTNNDESKSFIFRLRTELDIPRWKKRGFNSEEEYDTWLNQRRVCRFMRKKICEAELMGDYNSLFTDIPFVREQTGCRIPTNDIKKIVEKIRFERAMDGMRTFFGLEMHGVVA